MDRRNASRNRYNQTNPWVCRRRWPAVLALALLLTFISSRSARLLSHPEFAMLDQWVQLRPARPPSTDIVLVGIERSDIRANERYKRTHPKCTCMLITRDLVAQAVTKIKQAKARVVGLDMIFELPCSEAHDQPLLTALQQSGETVIMAGTNPAPGRFNFTQMQELSALTHPIMASPVLYNPRGVVRAVQVIQREETTLEKVGAANYAATPNAFPPFALACYAAFRGQGWALPEELTDDLVRCVDVNIPIWHGETVTLLGSVRSEETERRRVDSMLINWAGPAGTFPAYSLQTVLKETPENLRRLFENRIVIIGSTADRLTTPMSIAREDDGTVHVPRDAQQIDQSGENHLTGMEVHANALDTVLQRRFIQTVPAPLVLALMLGLSVLTLQMSRCLGGWRAVAFALVEVGVIFLAARYLLYADTWMFVVTPAVNLGLSAIGGAVVAFAEAREEAGALARVLERRDMATTTLVHDLKQPLTAINALAQVLRAEQQRGGGRLTPEVIERIQRQVQTALGDIDELLSTDPHRTLHLDIKRFDLAALARDLAVPQSLKTGIHQVEVDAPEEGLMVMGDPRYLGRALSNLMDNATKYWPAGGTVIVEIRREPGQVTTRVIDQGLGIAKEAQPRLFNRFERALPNGVDIPGTGIGLFSVKRIVEAHGGTVQVVSAPGEGSIFTIHLPDEPTISQPTEGQSRP